MYSLRCDSSQTTIVTGQTVDSNLRIVRNGKIPLIHGNFIQNPDLGSTLLRVCTKVFVITVVSYSLPIKSSQAVQTRVQSSSFTTDSDPETNFSCENSIKIK